MTRTDMHPDEVTRRIQNQRLGAVWPSGWTQRRADEYAHALADLHPDDLRMAVDDLIRQWPERFVPPPALIRAQADVHRRHRTDEADRRRRLARFQAGHTERIPRIRAVTNRPCKRAGCHGPISYIEAENVLWCHGCASGQALDSRDGKVRVKLRTDEVRDLEFQVDPSEQPPPPPDSLDEAA